MLILPCNDAAFAGGEAELNGLLVPSIDAIRGVIGVEAERASIKQSTNYTGATCCLSLLPWS